MALSIKAYLQLDILDNVSFSGFLSAKIFYAHASLFNLCQLIVRLATYQI